MYSNVTVVFSSSIVNCALIRFFGKFTQVFLGFDVR